MLAELAAAVRSGRLLAAELVGEAFRRIELHDGPLNAVVALRQEAAMHEADVIDRLPVGERDRLPLLGLPVLVKDLEDVAGMRTTFGSRLFAAAEPAIEDGVVPARLRAAGAIVIGKSNTSEFAWEGYTSNPLFGSTANPWNVEWSPGGSSGGSAAALAAGLAAIATGTDGGGSVRGPAALCGLVGLKPTNGLIGRRPIPAWIDLSTDGPMATSVDDVRLLLSVEAGPIHGDPTASPKWKPRRSRRPDRLLATTRLCPGDPPEPEVLALFAQAVEAVERVFARRVEVVAPASIFAGGNPDDDSLTMIGPEQRQWIGLDHLRDGERVFGAGFRSAMEDASNVSVDDYIAARRRRFLYTRQLDDLLGQATILLSPTWTVEGFTPDGRLIGSDTPGLPNAIVNTSAHNLSGHPSMSIPAGRGPHGIPFGLLVTGPRFRDDILIDFATTFEAACPWPWSAPGYAPLSALL